MSNAAHDQRSPVRAQAAPSLSLSLFQESQITVTRVIKAERDKDEAYTGRTQPQDAFLVCLQLRLLPAYPYWLNGRPVAIGPARSGQFKFLNLNLEHACYVRDPVDSLNAYVSRAALDSIAGENSASKIESLNIPQGDAIDDDVVRGLGIALLPALQKPEQVSQLFLDSIGTALLAHLASAYGGMRPEPQLKRGGLAPWQERRAKDILMTNLDGKISLEQLAGACGLSRSHFARAFKASTGLPPHRWLLAQRIERAQDLLLNSTLPIEEIASRCGFADQSHFTRIHIAVTGAAPGEWRRIHRS